MELEAANGQRVLATLVFAHALRYFKDCCLRELNDQLTLSTSITPGDIHWVITVPAIWRQSAKQFMRHAATQVCVLNVGSVALFCFVLLSQDHNKTNSAFTQMKYLIPQFQLHTCLLDATFKQMKIVVFDFYFKQISFEVCFARYMVCTFHYQPTYAT